MTLLGTILLLQNMFLTILVSQVDIIKIETFFSIFNPYY
jgi:hypothetical protein